MRPNRVTTPASVAVEVERLTTGWLVVEVLDASDAGDCIGICVELELVVFASYCGARAATLTLIILWGFLDEIIVDYYPGV